MFERGGWITFLDLQTKLELTAVGTKLTCGCCCPSSSWLDPGTQECNGSSLQASAPFESNFPWKYRRICLVITHSLIIRFPYAHTRKIYRYSSLHSQSDQKKQLLSRVGGDLFLEGNFGTRKLPIYLVAFYKECLDSWSILSQSSVWLCEDVVHQVTWNKRKYC